MALMSHWPQPEQTVIGATSATTVFNCPASWPQIDSFPHWMMAMDAQQYMADDILVKVDRSAMANSLETRVPLLDHRVVELAWQLPLNLKIREGKGKWVLREWAEELLAENRLQREGYFNAGPIHTLWREHLAGKRDNALKLWSILMFQAWLERQHD
jgi:asparagine synthase (glutamine-hydrolysing)